MKKQKKMSVGKIEKRKKKKIDIRNRGREMDRNLNGKKKRGNLRRRKKSYKMTEGERRGKGRDK